MNNEIKHTCIFCKKDEIHLAWHKRLYKCSCGVVYAYRPRIDMPGRGFAARQAEKAVATV